MLSDFSSNLLYPELLMEASWKTANWGMLRQPLTAPTMAAAQELGSPKHKLNEIFLAIVDTKPQDVEKLCTQCVQLSLHRWQLLPRVHTGANAHKGLLHLFHQLVELRESGQLMVEVLNYSQQRTLPALVTFLVCSALPSPTPYADFKSVLGTWRERLPNKWDNLSIWDDIFCWRTEVFQVIANSFSWGDAGSLACLHDTPWTVITQAHIARKQGLREVSLNSLSKLYAVATMDVQDAFEKLRQAFLFGQIIICHSSPSEHRGGLNIINNTNLDYFNSQQKAELFRLKAMFLSSLGAKQDANHAYSHAMQVCGGYGKGWLSWARYCDAIFAEQIKVHCAAQAMACYLQAVRHGSEGARLMLARVLWLLNRDDDKGTLGRTLESYGKALPEWVWIPWMAQLLTALTRREALHVKVLIRALAIKFPQALYYTMRAFLLERRELPTDKTGAAPTTGEGAVVQKPTLVRTATGDTVQVPAGTPVAQVKAWQAGQIASLPPPTSAAAAAAAAAAANAANHTEELMAMLRRAHSALGAEMETMLEEVIVHFRPEPEEELLSAVHALLIKCFQFVHMGLDEAVPSSLKTTLQRVCKKFFNGDTLHTTQKHKAFVGMYKATFEKDFIEEEAAVPSADGTEATEQTASTMSLAGVTFRLKKWKHLLQCRVYNHPSQIPLHLCSPYLAQIHCELETWSSSSQAHIEVPGQYSACYTEPKSALHCKLLQFDHQITILHRYGFSQRRIGMLGSDGKRKFFLVQFAIPHITRTDERVMQLHVMIKRLMEKNVQARRRDLNVAVPVVIPVTPRLRLMEDRPNYTSLGEVYELEKKGADEDPDAPILMCRDRVSAAVQAVKSQGSEKIKEVEERVKMEVYNEICEKHVKADILSRYVHGSLADTEAVWAFRRQFASQLGISSLLCYSFTCGERFPHRLMFDSHTACVISHEFRPGYTHQGLLDPAEDVPFRLTRNMVHLLSPLLVEGVMSYSMASVAQVLVQKKEFFEPYLALMLRDDLLSWHASKTAPRSETEQRVVEKQLQERMTKNVSKVMARLDVLNPKPDRRDHTSGAQLGVDHGVCTLLEAAQKPKALASMPAVWSSWL
ncbi:unnamed protein product [Chrysoparadoxa australica]